MAEKIKKFFARKKADAKFKLAGPAHRLNESSVTVVGPSKQQRPPPKRVEPTEATRQAAEAAMSRLSSQRKDTAFNTSLAAVQARVRKELEAEKKEAERSSPPKHEVIEKELPMSSHLAVNGVYFRCSIINDEILTKDEWKVKIKDFLYEQLEEERGLTACLIIHSCNYNRSKIADCVEVLCKYLDNIITNPDEPKFHKIRCSNPTFNDKVAPILGIQELLYAAGFRSERLDHNGIEEDFWVFNKANVEGLSTLEFLRDALKSEDRIELEIDRNVQVLSPAQASRRVELPQDFYALSPEDLKKEQQLRSEVLEKQMQLRTKAMREKDELREIRKYKFALIRIRFPDGLYLQGTFSVYEKYSDIIEFITENLEDAVPFILTSPTGHKFEESDYESTLFTLKLVPATILSFQWHSDVADEMSKLHGNFLKPEVMMLVQSL